MNRLLLPAATALAGLLVVPAEAVAADDDPAAPPPGPAAAGAGARPLASEDPAPVDARSTPSPAFVLSGQFTVGGAGTSFDAAAVFAASVLGAARVGRFELGAEVGLFAGLSGFDERTGDPPRLVSLGGEVGYRAHPGRRLTVPLRIRAGVLLPLGDTGVPDSAPDGEPWYLGGRLGLGFDLDPSLELEVTLLDVQGLYWRNEVGGLVAALALQAGLRVAWATAL